MLRWEQTAYVLHIDPFKETSGLVHFLTQDKGYVQAVARGMKRRRPGQATLQPFITWQIWVQGRGQLLTLTDYQACRYWSQSVNYAIAVSFSYVHELLLRLLRDNESGVAVFNAYEQVLEQLRSYSRVAPSIPLALRLFEKRLLAAIGYGLPLTHEALSTTPVAPDLYYVFDPLQGPRLVASRTPGAIRGDTLWALHHEVFENEQQLKEAKRVTRVALRAQLGDKPLHSQRLWLPRTTQKKEECEQSHE